jgi:hypothetical protein
MNVRTALRRFAASAVAVAGLTALAAFAQTASPRITAGPSVADADVSADSAIVRWSTDVESSTAVDFGTTTALGQTYRKIVPIEETEITEVNHSMSLWSLAPGTKYYYRVKSSVDGGGVVQSDLLTFTTKTNACTADVWDCGAWGTCAKGTDGAYAQLRACALKEDCPTVETPKPAETQACTPACTEDTWSCGAWGSCSADGRQTRSCTLKTDCPTVTTAKPAESQSCAPACTEDTWECRPGKCALYEGEGWRIKEECRMTEDCPAVKTTRTPTVRPCCDEAPEGDKWTCTDWGECVEGIHRRECRQTSDCPEIKLEAPLEVGPCDDGGTDVTLAAPDDGPTVGDRQTVTTSPTDATDVAPSPAPSAGAAVPPAESVLAAMGATEGQASDYADECAKAGIFPERCASWLATKYADKSCEAQGLFTKESCEKSLTDGNNGVFPGCEGKSAEECDAIKARATIGYLPEDEKKKVDDIITTKKVGAAFEELGAKAALLVAVRETKKDEVRWYPSAKTEGKETSPGVIVFDVDKDGLPDDLEKRLGTDPKKADFADEGGIPSAVVSTTVLKSFFEKGDKPTQFVIVDTDGDGSPDMVIDDRKLLGLKTYDPAKTYVVGDSVIYNGKAPKPLPTSFFDGENVGVDTDGDGKPNGKISRNILKSFFEKGDKPTQSQFANLIDSTMISPTDRAFLTGKALEQPLGAGEVDATFTVTLATKGGTEGPGKYQCSEDKNCPPEYPQCVDGRCIGDGYDVNGPPPGLENRVDTTGTFDPKKWNVLSGHAAPNTTVLLYVYSYVPMVLTTTTDENGNYTYDLADNVVDGEHTAYVAVTDDTGKIMKKSEPLALFVKGAIAATSEEDFLKPDVNVQPDSAITSYSRYYLYGTIVLVLVALGFGWRFVSKMKGGETKA